MTVSIFYQTVFKEYRLPNIENIDYSIYLDAKLFRLNKSKRIELENEDGVWYIKEFSGLKSSRELNGDRFKMSDAEVFGFDINGVELKLLCCESSSEYKPYRKFDITSCTRFTVGKDSSNDIIFNSLDLISKTHALFVHQGASWYVSDKSTNGVFLNSVKVNGEQPLSFGDVVSMFGLSIIYLGNTIAVGSSYGKLEFAGTVLGDFIPPGEYVHVDKTEPKVFNRSPRSKGHIYEEVIEIESPPQMQTSKKQSILTTIGPSFTMTLPMLIGCLIAIYNSKKSGSMNSAFMYTGIITALGAALIGSFWAFRNMKEARKNEISQEQKRFKTYSEYLVAAADDIQTKYRSNIEVLNKTYPSAEEICRYTDDSVELWNRNYYHKDFMYHRIGIGDMPFQCQLSVSKLKFSMDYDALRDKPNKIEEQYKMLHNVPLCIDLINENLYGIVGAAGRKGAISIMHSLAAQIAANNCYTDVKMVFVYNAQKPSDRENWDFLRWLPHVYSENRKVRFIASDKIEAADVFFELANVIRQRLDEMEDNKHEIVRPHYVVFIEDYSLLDGEPISKYLIEPHNNYGVTTFILADYYYNLPNTCENIIENDEFGSFIYNAVDTENEKKKVIFDMVSPAVLERFAKSIADTKVAEAENDSEIPNSLSFLDMYGVKKLEGLCVMDRWRKNRTYNTMKALIGKKAGGADCYLDIHEKYHGPHGLVAGTTGSGKSETLQTYILSLAINFSPEDVAFLIIDFKGGGMANLFENLPHMAGVISNLSGNQINRAMVSIKSEIRRRQVIFSENSVNNINAYTNLFKSKEAAVPVPHLLIVIDEFAEMKREEPEFMKELISVAQVGRSLGIHLILATQKPSGTVDDNIWSNTKFRLCLRVQNRSDSMDMLHKPDAAYLSQAGRCFLQVGNDEIFELFQSGWSGAIYNSSSEDYGTAVTMISLTGKTAIIGNRAKIRQIEAVKHKWVKALCTEYFLSIPKYNASIGIMDSMMLDEFITYIIGRLRQSGFRYGDTENEKKALIDFYKHYDSNFSIDMVDDNVEDILHRGIKLPELKEVSQLDAIVDYLAELSARNGLGHQGVLWLPPLGEMLFLSELPGYTELSFEKTHWQNSGKYFTLEVPVGLCDDPENQVQMPLTVDFAKAGHLAVIGSVVSGKSTFMQTLLYSLCDRFSPERLNMYILDFSSRLLMSFENAPHCGGVLGEKDVDKIGKLLNLINKIIEERKALFNGGTYAQYVKAYGLTIPAVIIAVDNYAGFKEKTENKYEQFFVRLARDGAGYGIFMMLSAQGFGMNEIPNRIGDSISNVITLSLGDKFKYMDVLRTTQIPMVPEVGVKGRGLASYGNRLLEFQTAVCLKAEDDYARFEGLKKSFEAMQAGWNGPAARSIPSIPEEPALSVFYSIPEVKKQAENRYLIPDGYVLADASVHFIDLHNVYCYTISGKQRTGKTNLLRVIIEGAAAKKYGKIVIYDKGNMELAGIGQKVEARMIETDDELFAFLSELLPDFKRRNQKKRALSAEGHTDTEILECMLEEEPYYIFINDLTVFLKSVYTPKEGIEKMSGFVENIIEKGALHGVFFFGCIDTDKAYEVSVYKAYSDFVKYKCGTHLGGSVSTQQIFTFQNIPFNETNKVYKKGLGLTPDSEDDTYGHKIIIPMAGR